MLATGKCFFKDIIGSDYPRRLDEQSCQKRNDSMSLKRMEFHYGLGDGHAMLNDQLLDFCYMIRNAFLQSFQLWWQRNKIVGIRVGSRCRCQSKSSLIRATSFIAWNRGGLGLLTAPCCKMSKLHYDSTTGCIGWLQCTIGNYQLGHWAASHKIIGAPFWFQTRLIITLACLPLLVATINNDRPNYRQLAEPRSLTISSKTLFVVSSVETAPTCLQRIYLLTAFDEWGIF